METVKKLLDRILSTICVGLFGALVVLVTWQVFTRFVLNNPSTFSEELAKYCFVWLVLFGAAFVFGENGHMRIEFIQDALPKKLKIGVQIFIELCIIAFSALVLLSGGLTITKLAWVQMSAALHIPVGYLYAVMPICGVIVIFYCIYNIYYILKHKKPLEIV
ncbi:TRAP transporter small permease [Lysinibacillus sp. SGAir0095]|uniref:TRAP transporter small permease n=1 Tax=Lysinibacillus sp. SGAir0095 TaxID=2070463 RepID=UPI0010CD076C|nr:TRAP transporter small permease [Lysinibacillus sp. SGAir0095]QCR33514.1 TRAP transporter small permease [Lysinibacillus sp. SGAir0095]